ncbi:HlyD family secretion protein [Sphingomonas sp. BAUL-RG-20F-R05-02]|uniref:HlyD family secretion protein n=1 Tax=Sphingomonas sp. BAUL-RG-20F-R05-02 TaxID=2914830 RepID=UPI001F5798F1|nr:HlyD family secretion protein [Sphingomonas sp. BAUL-RG-20F-R05-02]
MTEDQAPKSGNGSDDRNDDQGDEQESNAPSSDKQRDGGQDKQSDQSDDAGDDKGDDKPKKPSLVRKPLFWIIVVVVAAIIVIAGVLYYLHARQYESTDDAFVDAHIVRIAPNVAGTLVQVANVDNRHVEPGRLLAVIQPNGPEATLSEARANVSQATAQAEQSRAQVVAAQAAAAKAEEQARGPLADAQKAAQDLGRYQQLQRIDPQAVAGQQLDQARATARATAANAAAARREITSAQAQVEVARRQVAASEAVIAARQAQVKQANVTIGYLRLTAPVSGQVVNRQVNLGSYVGPGTQLMAIVPDHVWVTANFKETQLRNMKIGQPVEIKVDAYPDVKFHGHVDSVQRGAGQAFALLPPQNATGNYVKVVQRVPVRIEFDRNGKDAPDPRKYPIGPGMSVIPTVKVR